MGNEILEATKRNDIASVRASIGDNPDEGAILWSLFEAIEQNNLEIVELLIQTGIDVNEERVYRASNNSIVLEGTAIIDAAGIGNLEIVKLLIEAGADVNFVPRRNTDEPSALMMAAQNGHLEVVKVLVEAGADVNLLRDGPSYALLSAASCGYRDVFNFLLPLTNPELREEASEALPEGIMLREVEENANPAVCALTDAVRRNDFGTVKKLLESDVDIDGLDRENSTALYIASVMQLKEIVRLLLDAGADVNKGTVVENLTPLIGCLIGVPSEETVSICSWLLEAGANVNARERDKGRTPLMHAVTATARNNPSRLACLQHVKLLIEAGADINAKNHQGETALDLVKSPSFGELWRQEVCRLLLEAGAIEV